MPAEDGGRAQQLMDLLKILAGLAIVWSFSFALRPVKTLRDTYGLAKGEYSNRAISTTALEYEPDLIDEMWYRNRGGGGE